MNARTPHHHVIFLNLYIHVDIGPLSASLLICSHPQEREKENYVRLDRVSFRQEKTFPTFRLVLSPLIPLEATRLVSSNTFSGPTILNLIGYENICLANDPAVSTITINNVA